jgi:O-acetyl-ADP-ribose deacetylase (regulator of RNase III)
MVDTVTEHLANSTTLEEVLIVTMDEREYKPFKQAIEQGA